MWYMDGNDLALVEAIRQFVRNNAQADLNYTSGLIGTARQIGMSEDNIREALASDRCLTIYEP